MYLHVCLSGFWTNASYQVSNIKSYSISQIFCKTVRINVQLVETKTSNSKGGFTPKWNLPSSAPFQVATGGHGWCGRVVWSMTCRNQEAQKECNMRQPAKVQCIHNIIMANCCFYILLRICMSLHTFLWMCDLPSMTLSVNAHFNSCRKASNNETFKSIYWGELGSMRLKDLKVQRSVISPNQCWRWNTTRVYHHGLQSPTPLFASKLTALSFRMSGVASWTYIWLVH